MKVRMKTGKRRIGFAVAFAVIFVAVFFAGIAFGSVMLPLSRMIGALRGSDRTAAVILFDLRLPRVLAAALAGAGLATAGCLLQTVTDNDLCAPNIIGVNAGAGFVVMLMISAFPMLWRFLPLGAFLGAVLTAFLVLSLSYTGQSLHAKSTVVLAGVAVSSMLNAGISFLSIRYPEALSSYTAFSVGGFSGVAIKDLTVPAVMIAGCFAASFLLAPKLGVLCLGDETAATLGVRVKEVRIAAILLSSALCAAVVSFAGLLGFVGLVVPHMVRHLIGGSLRIRLPFVAAGGAILVMLADLAGRTLFRPGELPAGIFMALLGAPFFLYLLLRKRRRTE